MKNIILIVTLFILSGCASLSKKNSFEMRPYKTVTLQNGLDVLLLEDNSLPYFSMTMLMSSGAVFDEPGKKGTGFMVGQLLDKGTSQRSATKIADDIGFIGGEFGVSVSDDYTMISSSSLSIHQDKVIDNFSEILLEPKFSNSEIKRLKKQMVSSLKKVVDEPRSFAGEAYSNYIYGNSHPYGERIMGSFKSIKAIKRADLLKYYKKHYRPNNATLAVVGDFSSQNIIEVLNKKLGAWNRGRLLIASYPEIPKIEGVQGKLIYKPDLAQSQVFLGHKGIKRSDKDYMSLRIASTALGGTFTSRLMKKIRIEKGLTYSIRSSYESMRSEGLFTVSTFTRHEKVGETVSETLSVLENFRKQGLTRTEFKNTVALIKGTFPRAIETPEKLAYNLLLLKFHGISDDYLKNFYKNLDKISLSDVNNAIERHLHPKNIKVLVYGPKKVSQQLEGAVNLEKDSYRSYLK